ncbi:MAG TPA: sugar ABC transporter permease [bacterium]|nr:sugar ABC transporter permease [bacterium]
MFGRYLFCYVMLLVPAAFFVLFRVSPIVQTLRLSVLNWDLISRVKPFVGLDNFRTLLEDSNFRLALSNTTVFAAATVVASVVLALLVALPLAGRPAAGVARRLRFEGAYQLIYFLPFITPTVPEAVVWKWIYDARYGILNYVLGLVGIPPLGWLIDPRITLWAVIIMSVWKTLGYNMVLFIIGLRAIPAEYMEAGLIDGATGWRFFRFLTLPLLMPTVLLVTVISTIGAYNVFTQVYVLAADIQGSPGSVVRVLIYDIFENAFRFYRMGYASAEATVFFAIVLLLTLAQFRVLRSRTE